jgi:hypothetical protein
MSLTEENPEDAILRQESEVDRLKSDLYEIYTDIDATTKLGDEELTDYLKHLKEESKKFYSEKGSVIFETTNILTDANEELSNLTRKIYSYYDKIDIFTIISISGVLIYYLYSVHIISSLSSVNLFYVVFGIAIASISKITTSFLRKEVNSTQKKLYSALNGKFDIIREKLIKNKLFKIDIDVLSRYAATLLEKNKLGVDTARILFPKFNALFATKARIASQRVFKNELRTSIVRYGLNNNNSLLEMIEAKNLLVDSENEFIEVISKELGPPNQIDPAFIRLSYFDLKENKSQSIIEWSKISKSNTLLRELIGHILSTIDVDRRSFDLRSKAYGAIYKLIASEEVFNIERFFEIYEKFYGPLLEDKKTLVNGLKRYGFTDVECEEMIMSYPPKTVQRESYETELFNVASSFLKVDASIISLIYQDEKANIEKRAESWRILTKSDGALREFVTRLVFNGFFVKSNEATLKMSKYITFLSLYFKNFDSFSLSYAIDDVSGQIKQITQVKNEFTSLLERYSLNLKDKGNKLGLSEYIPSGNFSDKDYRYEIDIADYISSMLNINSSFLLLLYYDYTESERVLELYGLIKQNNNIAKLSDFLIGNGIMKLSSDTEPKNLSNMLTSLLKQERMFGVSRIKDIFYEYFQIYDYSLKIVLELEDEGILEDSNRPSFGEIVSTLKDYPDSFGLFSKVSIVILSKLKASNIIYIRDDKAYNSLKIASTAIYATKFSMSGILEESCKNAMLDETALKIIYKFVEIRGREELLSEGIRTNLREICNKVLEEEYQNYEDINLLRQHLGLKLLPNRIGDLRASRMKDMINTMSRTKQATIERLEKKIIDMQEKEERVKTFFNQRLTTSLIRKSLDMQLFSAYIITSKGGGAIMTEIVDNYLPTSAKSLYRKYRKTELSNLIMKAPGPAIGNNTRIGLVPIGLGFEEFGRYFNEAYLHAVRRRLLNKGNQETVAGEEFSEPVIGEGKYHANLIRINPSGDTFTRIGDENDEVSDDHPLQAIKGLMSRYAPFQRFSIIASMEYDDENKTESLIRVVSDFVDIASGIDNINDNKISTIIRNQRIKKSLEDGVFDKNFKKMFQTERISTYSLELYSKFSGSKAERRKNIADNFEEKLKSVIKSLGAKPSKEDFEKIKVNVLEGLMMTGEVLTTLKFN